MDVTGYSENIFEYEAAADNGVRLQDPLLIRTCACCSEILQNDNNKTSFEIRNETPLTTMIARTFSVPNWGSTDDDSLCCQSCSKLIANMNKGFQALKKRIRTHSRLESFFLKFQNHMVSFSEPATCSSRQSDWNRDSTCPTTHGNQDTLSTTTQNYSYVNDLPVSVKLKSFPQTINLEQISSGVSPQPSSETITCDLGEGEGRTADLSLFTSEWDYPNPNYSQEERKEYRRSLDVLKLTSVDCPAMNCGKFFTGETVDTIFANHMMTVHPVFVCCNFCSEVVHGGNPESARQLLKCHEEDQHGAEDVSPQEDQREAVAFALGTKMIYLKCRFCSIKFHGAENGGEGRVVLRRVLFRHIQSQHPASLQCDQCSRVLRGTPATIQAKMKNHVQLHHQHQSHIICGICQKPQPSIDACRRHEFTHYNQTDKEDAVRKDPSIETSCLCPACGLILKGFFIQEKNLVAQHMRKSHPSSKELEVKKPIPKTRRLSCTQCEYSTTDARALATHKEHHNEGGYCKFVCQRCGMGFKAGQGREYKGHTMVCCDEKDRPIPCTEQNCLRRFKTKQNLMIHLVGFHKQAAEDARKFLYPGLPVHDWVRNISAPKKRKVERDGDPD